jgi:hypothetical protein
MSQYVGSSGSSISAGRLPTRARSPHHGRARSNRSRRCERAGAATRAASAETGRAPSTELASPRKSSTASRSELRSLDTVPLKIRQTSYGLNPARGSWPLNHEREEFHATHLLVLVVLALVSAGTASSSAIAPGERPASGPERVLYWSQVAESTISVGRPPASSEVLNGLVHAAIYDAVDVGQGRVRAVRGLDRRSGPTSVDAASPLRSRRARRRVCPGRPRRRGGLRDVHGGIPDGERRPTGSASAELWPAPISRFEATTASTTSFPWVQSARRAPVCSSRSRSTARPVDIKLKQVRPLAFDDNSRFRPDGPTALTSRAYTRDFNEVKRLGRIDRSGADARADRDRTLLDRSRRWSFFNRNLRNLASRARVGHRSRRRACWRWCTSPPQTRSSGCWERSSTTLLAAADRDPAGRHRRQSRHDRGPSWTHLFLGNHPEYPSGHACFTGAVTRALAGLLRHRSRPVVAHEHGDGTTHSFDRSARSGPRSRTPGSGADCHFRKSTDDGDLLAKQDHPATSSPTTSTKQTTH